MPDSLLPISEVAKKNVSKVMNPLVSWLVSSGVGYSEFSQSLKIVFLKQSIKELEKLDKKLTDSSISLLSGLNRRDVSELKGILLNDTLIQASSNISARVVTLWIQKEWPKQIAITGDGISFESLAKEISQDKHPRAIISELDRLGLITEVANTVILHTESFTPSNSSSYSQKLLAQSASDHISSGLSNILISPNMFLEQNINADELTEESIEILKNYTHDIWKEMSKKLVDKALECTKNDEGKLNARYRFSMGIYQFDEMLKKDNPEK